LDLQFYSFLISVCQPYAQDGMSAERIPTCPEYKTGWAPEPVWAF